MEHDVSTIMLEAAIDGVIKEASAHNMDVSKEQAIEILKEAGLWKTYKMLTKSRNILPKKLLDKLPKVLSKPHYLPVIPPLLYLDKSRAFVGSLGLATGTGLGAYYLLKPKKETEDKDQTKSAGAKLIGYGATPYLTGLLKKKQKGWDLKRSTLLGSAVGGALQIPTLPGRTFSVRKLIVGGLAGGLLGALGHQVAKNKDTDVAKQSSLEVNRIVHMVGRLNPSEGRTIMKIGTVNSPMLSVIKTAGTGGDIATGIFLTPAGLVGKKVKENTGSTGKAMLAGGVAGGVGLGALAATGTHLLGKLVHKKLPSGKLGLAAGTLGLAGGSLMGLLGSSLKQKD